MLNFNFLIVLIAGLLIYLTLTILFKKWRDKNQLTVLILSFYLPFLIAITVFPIYFDQSLIALKKEQNSITNGFNFIPFKETIRVFSNDKAIFYKNVIGNFLLLTPLVFLLIIKQKSFLFILMTIIATSLTIEALQLLKNTIYNFSVNCADIDDLIFNITGGIISYFPFKLFYNHSGKNE